MNQNKTRKPRRRRKGARRLRYDRVAILAGILLAVIGLTAFLTVRACSDATQMPEPSHTEAVAAGRRDAGRLLDTFEGSMERQNVLLHIHAVESELRLHGYNADADAYIAAVREFMKTHNL